MSLELVIYAGAEGAYGHADGPVQRATFDSPRAICGDTEGNTYVLDGDAQYVRHIGSRGEVRTLSLSATRDGTRIEVKSLRAIVSELSRAQARTNWSSTRTVDCGEVRCA